MSYRKTPLVVNETYHVFNRSIAREPIFVTYKDRFRAIDVIEFYSYKNPTMRFSHYKRLPLEARKEFIKKIRNKSEKLVEILAFCLMPNHVHFLIREIETGGIKTFMSIFQNSYAKYINTKYKRTGSLFQSIFKAVRIETDDQLIHVARYIHLNPYTSSIIPTPDALLNYRWSSFQDYTSNTENSFISKELLLGLFKNKNSLIKFTLDHADYQRRLSMIKHLALE